MSRQAPKPSSGWAAKTARAISSRPGFWTPRNGISDFMYARMPAALSGFARASSSRRTASISAPPAVIAAP